MALDSIPLLLLLLVGPCFAQAGSWTLQTNYTANNFANFFDKFSFWTDADPTGGTVQFVSQSDARAADLLGSRGSIYIGVDNTTTLSGSAGRKAVRLTSNEAYNPGTLVVADIKHMPGGICGTWPAFWMTAASSDWPQQGEIDIIEETNNSENNQMTLHVSNKQGPSRVDDAAVMTATKSHWGDCTEEGQGGCGARDLRKNSFGVGFNKEQGGVYAMEWTSSHIRIWFFPRSVIPQGNDGPLGPQPNPASWGTPTTSFEGREANFNAHVKNQRIIINTTFCGNWGSGTWQSSGCAKSTGVSTCPAYVRANPEAFTDAFWTFSALNVYRQN